MRDGDDERHYTTYVHAPAAETWQRLSGGESQASWYMPAVDWELRDEGRLSWGANDQVFVLGTIDAYRPDAFFLSHSFGFPFLDEPPGRVRWRITQMGEVTQVWLRHELGAQRPATGGIVGGSWPVMLARLKTLVETGQPMPEPVWPTTEGWDDDPT